jgi:hypothetical protein
VSQHPVRGLRASQDGGSEPDDEGAVLALNLVANSHSLDGNWFLVDELLRKVWLATPVPEEVMRAGPADRGQHRSCRAVPVPHASAYLLPLWYRAAF